MLANKLMSALTGNSDEPLYSDSVFSTYLYTGNGSTQTITNGIDLAGKGGMVWVKSRIASGNNLLHDTARGNYEIKTNSTGAQENGGITYGAGGFSLNNATSANGVNNNTQTYASWTFRKAPKFFDVVTYTGNGTAGRQIPHNLGCDPGMIIVKRTNDTSNWVIGHIYDFSKALNLNNTNAATTQSIFSGTDASVFSQNNTSSAGADGYDINQSGGTYVAYLFAHDPSADGIIQCGSFTTDASGNATVNLGWEPQFAITRGTVGGNWQMQDSMRGIPVGSQGKRLSANSPATEDATDTITPNATGFSVTAHGAGATYIYLAIRRPNKPPTTGTQVYNAIARTGTGAAATVAGVGFAPDLVLTGHRTNPTFGFSKPINDRLRGPKTKLYVNSTDAESTTTASLLSFDMDGITLGADTAEGSWNENTASLINHFFKRAPGFFDVVCYTGDGATSRDITHGLGVKPQLLIIKSRSAANLWSVSAYLSGDYATSILALNTTGADGSASSGGYSSYLPSTSTFRLSAAGGAVTSINSSAVTYVAYLFATPPGISKVGSYTGNGSSQTINCGFTTGARFVLIKKTSGTGDWLVADTTRGLVSGGDPRLSLNTTAAEVTGEDWIDPAASGFIINQTAADANANGATYIFLSVA